MDFTKNIHSSLDIRTLRKKFWESKQTDHKLAEPCSLIPDSSDKTVMFNTSGMQQLVPYLTGKAHPLGKRLYNIQPCLRTNDIEDIGDERHLSMFEMMGNWSLGDYFKKEALTRSLQFVTQELQIPIDRIGVTVFGGVPDGSQDIPFDQEAKDIRLSLGIPEYRIKAIPLVDGESDNFRGPPGAVGPCGPCSEIYVDRGDAYGPADRDMGVNDRYTEIWNNVFMEFYKGSEEEAKKKRSEEMKALDQKTEKIIGFAIEIHKKFGSTITEKQLNNMLADKLKAYGFIVQQEKAIDIIEDGKKYGNRFIDIVVDNEIFIELKNTTQEQEIKKGFRQLRSYLELGHGKAGLLLNTAFSTLSINRFNIPLQTSSYSRLLQKNVDTGMGFERLMMVLQGKETIFETDVFAAMFKAIQAVSGQTYPAYHKLEADYSDHERAIVKSMRIICDHIRASSFLVAQGVIPSNEGRGYILRRLIRRAFSHLQRICISTASTLHPAHLTSTVSDLVVGVIQGFGEIYPVLKQRETVVIQTITQEMLNFQETIIKGEQKLSALFDKKLGGRISGADAFLLYESFGLPIEMTVEFAGERGLEVDVEGFNQEMSLAQERSRAGSGKMFAKGIDRAAYLEGIDKTAFIGYDQLETSDSKVLKDFVLDNGQRVIILDKTVFYAESGGQKGDQGTITLDSGEVVTIRDTIKYAGVVLHLVG